MRLPLSPDARSALLVVDMQAYTLRLPERRNGCHVGSLEEFIAGRL